MKGIIFDCDGVLVDSEKWSCSAWLPVLRHYGITAQLPQIEAFLGRSDQALLDHFGSLGHKLNSEQMISEHEAAYFALARNSLQTFPGLPQLLTSLQHQQYSLAVASSGRPEKINFSLQETGLNSYFSIICSAVEVVQSKPAPDLFLLAAKRLQLPATDCLVIEDARAGIQAARSAGMHVWGFTSSLPASALKAAGAHMVFNTYEDLRPHLVR